MEHESKDDNSLTEINESNRFKKRADKAFKNGNYQHAYELYNKALLLESQNYDLISCLIGTALNLGFIDEVLQKSEHLIQMSPSKAQGYYLKGIANDLLFKFELAIECFIKALEFERDHSNLILKNLIKTITKYLDRDENFQFDDSTDLNDEEENLVKLIELVEILIKKRKLNLCLKIINYIESTESKNYSVKTELLLVIGKLFKTEKNFEKALLAFEESYYLANLKNDFKLKIKSIVSISSCYLELRDLHKVILYYHKLIDIESYLLANEANSVTSESNENNDSIINLELRIAIRQNLFTAHFRLGKLRISAYYLNEVIDLVDNYFKLDTNQQLDPILIEDSFELIQVKIDASLELVKLYYVFEEFVLMQNLLDRMLKFTEELIDNVEINTNLREKQTNNLRYFRIKSYSWLGVCLAGLREFRNSKLATKKCLCLIEKEMETYETNIDKNANNSILIYLKSLKVECLIDACQALNQFKKTFEQMSSFNCDILITNFKVEDDSFVFYEVKTLLDSSRQMINFAKNAYIISNKIIDPNLRVQSTFNLALCLYENHFYQSAAYYFNQIFSISITLLHEKPNSLAFYTDSSPDYHMESMVYFVKSQLMVDYFEDKSVVDFEIEEKTEVCIEPLEILIAKLVKSFEIITKYIIKWKMEETNRASFLFSLSHLDAIKFDNDSKRLKKVLKICCECLIYACYKLNRLNECLIYMDAYDFVVNLSIKDLIDMNLVSTSNNELNMENFLNFDRFSMHMKTFGNFSIRYKFIFECKILFVFIIQAETGLIVHTDRIKLSVILQDFKMNESLEILFDSKLDYIYKRLEIVENEWIKMNLNGFEYRNVPIENIDLAKLRADNRNNEMRLFSHFLNDKKNKGEYFYEFNLEDIDLINFNLRKILSYSIESINIKKLTNSKLALKLDLETSLEDIVKIFRLILLKPVESYLENNLSASLIIDSKYSKMFSLAFNSVDRKIYFSLCPDSFVKSSFDLLQSIEKYQIEENELNLAKKKVLDSPNRAKNCEIENAESKSNITPRYTSHPKRAVDFLNGHVTNNKENHVELAKSRLDTSISALITQTHSGTDAKRSALEIIEYTQINRPEKICVIGCPDIPNGFLVGKNFKMTKFLTQGLVQLTKIADLLNAKPIFSSKCTKQEILHQLETSSLIFLSTLSSNESDSVLICSESTEYPSSFTDEYKKYCLLTSRDLDFIQMYKCNLLVLNCYSTLNHKPRIELAKKIMSRGCKSVLLVLSPLTDQLMSEFYISFFEALKAERKVDVAYSNAILKLTMGSDVFLKSLIRSSFCMITADSKLHLNVSDVEKSMLQLNIDKTLDHFKTEQNLDYLNPDSKISILSTAFKSSLEKTLVQLQVLIKLLLNQFLVESNEISTHENLKYKEIFLYLNETVSKSVIYMTLTKVKPEPLNELVQENNLVINLLKCLGFSTHRQSIYVVRDQKEKLILLFPDNRYLDLCMRTSHVLGCLIELCFGEYSNLNEHYFYRTQIVIKNLEALMPLEDQNLLNCLIDIISLTKFSPEIILALTDDSVQYAFAYYGNQGQFKYNTTYNHLIDKDILKWNYRFEPEKSRDQKLDPQSMKYLKNNKVVNFLLSIGFEIIGPWLQFNQSQFNSLMQDIMLKFLTSFQSDRDMSLYKEMNINVLGERSPALSRNQSSLNLKKTEQNKEDLFDVCIAAPWAMNIEDNKKMNSKIEFIEKYKELSKKISKQRRDALENHLEYVMKQSIVNNQSENLPKSETELEKALDDSNKLLKIRKIKYKQGGGPSKTRVIANEKYKISYQEISKLREYSHYACQKNIEKIEVELKEKTQKLILPLIRKSYNI